MKQQTLARWLKIIVVGMGICGLVIFFALVPVIGCGIVQSNPEFSHWFRPWMLFVWAAAIPCYIVLMLVWQIAGQISADRSFTAENSLRVKKIMILALADSAFVFAVSIIFFFAGINHPGTLLACLFISFAGVVIGVFAGCVSHLVHKAAVLREENESFI